MQQRFQYIIGMLSLIFLMFVLVISFHVHKETEDKLSAQFSRTELIMANYVAHNLKSNIEELISELESITGNPDAINMNIMNIPYFVKNNMHEIMYSGHIYNLIFVSAKGKIVYYYPDFLHKKHLQEDYDLSVIENNLSELKDGNPVLSKIYPLHNDKEIVAVSLFVPLLSSDIEYKGSIGVLVNMSSIRNEYISPLEELITYELTILDEEGKYLESVRKEHSGLHYFGAIESSTFASNDPNVKKFIKKILKEKENVSSFSFQKNANEWNIGYLKKFAAFTTISIANRTWYIILSTPYEEVSFLIQKNLHYILMIMIVTIMFTLLISFLLVRTNKKRILAENAASLLKAEKAFKSELYYSEEKYKMIMEDALEGIAIFKGVELKEANEAWVSMFDTTIEECVGMSIYDIVNYDSIDLVREYFTKDDINTDDAPVHYDITVITRKGRKRTHNISLSRLTSLDKMICIVSRDVTERRTEEQEIHDAKVQLEKANKDLDIYISSIVHDIKNPLVAAQGFFNVILNEYCTTTGDGTKDDYIKRVHTNFSHIFDLLNSLLELSKIGRVKKHIERIDIKRTIIAVKGYLNSFIDEKKAQINLTGNLPIIYTDRALINQVLENLISNAIKFSKDGHNPVIDIGGDDIGDYIEFYVKDNGIGIEEKDYDKLFKIFGRINNDIPGSGVGLNIVKKVLEELGGGLRFESEPGVGTTFFFTIPKKKGHFYLKGLRTPD